MPSFVTHLESAIDGTTLPARQVQTTHADRPLWVRYDLAQIGRSVSGVQLAGRPATMWRYRELLPFEDERSIVSLAETATPLMPCPRLGAAIGLRHLLIKDESRLPTGSFKARGMAMAVTMARELGIEHLALPTAGNAGGAAAAYAARAGLRCSVFMPADTPRINRLEVIGHAADCTMVDGLISDCGARVRDGVAEHGWFDLSTLREPYRIEGKKTMGLELADQMGWSLPDVILYPTGGGTGLIGMWKAFGELAELGWLRSERLPRLFSCQSGGCAPIVEAFERGERFASPAPNPATIASGLRVPGAIGDFMILDAVRASGGRAMAAAEDRLLAWTARAAALEGISLCPEAAACLDVLGQALDAGFVEADETVVLFNTAALQKYAEVMEMIADRVSRGRV